MKNVLLASTIFFLIPQIVYAETVITTGDSSVEVHVENNIQSTSNTSSNNSTTRTHIEIESNGEKKVLDTDKPGTYDLSIKNGGGESSVHTSNGSTSADIDDDSGADEDESGEAKESQNTKKEIRRSILEKIEDLFLKIFSIFN